MFLDDADQVVPKSVAKPQTTVQASPHIFVVMLSTVYPRTAGAKYLPSLSAACFVDPPVEVSRLEGSRLRGLFQGHVVSKKAPERSYQGFWQWVISREPSGT